MCAESRPRHLLHHRIPLTMAIISALIVEAGGERFAIPQLAVIELARVRSDSEHRIDWLKDTPVLRSRDKLLPVAHLKKLLAIDPDPEIDAESGFIVVLQIGSEFSVSSSTGFPDRGNRSQADVGEAQQHRDVLRQHNSRRRIRGDDHRPARHRRRGRRHRRDPCASDDRGRPFGCGGRTTPMLLFRAGSQQQKAVPLSLVTRLEVIDAHAVETSNGSHLLQYPDH